MKIKIFLWATIVWILPLIYVTQRNEAKFKKNILIGTTLPQEAHDDPDVQHIIDVYLKKTKMWTILLAAVIVPCFLPKGFTWLLALWMIWLDGVIVLPQIPFVKANKQLRALKKEKGWVKKPEEQEEVRVNFQDISTPKWISPWVFIGAFVLTLLPIAIKQEYWISVLANALGQILFYVCYRFCFRAKSEMVDDNVELTKALTQLRRCHWARFWIKCAFATAIFSYSFLLIGEHDGWFYAAIAVYTFYIGGAAMKQEIKIRGVQEKLTVDCGRGDFIDDDDYWLWGMFYCNKNDSHTMVNARVGMGTTVNIARPFGKFIMVLAVVCLVMMPPFPFILDASIDSEIGFEQSGHQVVVNCGREEWRLNPKDIESMELLNEYPEGLRRTWGTATDKVLKGNFTADGMRLVLVALNPDKPPYLLIKTKTNKYYLFGLDGPEGTQALYKALGGQ